MDGGAKNRKSEATASLFRISPLPDGRGRGWVFRWEGPGVGLFLLHPVIGIVASAARLCRRIRSSRGIACARIIASAWVIACAGIISSSRVISSSRDV